MGSLDVALSNIRGCVRELRDAAAHLRCAAWFADASTGTAGPKVAAVLRTHAALLDDMASESESAVANALGVGHG